MKRLIAIILALSLIFIYFAVAVSATEITNTMTSQEYYAAQAYLVAHFKDDNISYSEFQERSQAVTDEFVEANTVGGVLTQSALTASNTFNAVSQKIGETVSNFGDSAKDYISDWISDFLDDYSVFSDKTTTDLKGYGALMYVVVKSGNYSNYSRYYCNYILAKPGASYVTYYTRGGYYREYWDSSNTTVQTFTSTSNFGEHNRVEGSSTTTVYVYGDVRYEDGSQAPTNDEFQTVKDYDFSDTSEQDLQELLNKILEELERQQPDLSTVEGLLKSIYNRLGKLDSDNDNALLNDINLAILSLMKSNDDNAKEIAEALLGIREDLKNGSSDSSVDSSDTNSALGSHNHDTISGTLYNVKPLDKNFFNKLFTDATELKVEYEGKNYFLEPCGCLKIDDKYYSVDMNYDSFTTVDYDFNNIDIDVDSDLTSFNYVDMNLSPTQRKKIDNIVEMASTLVSKGIPFAAVNGGLTFYQDIIFNSHDPQDIVIDINLFGNDIFFTILSTSFFNSEASQALQIVKNFVCIVVCYAWLLAMRRKTASMMG